ncbi:MAG: sulfatase-like hydrolase/transferase [bacterium]
MDTLRWDQLKSNNQSHFVSPEVKSFRNDAICLSNLISTSGWTFPSHASLFSGFLPYRHGALNKRSKINPDVALFPQYLKKVDYATAGITDKGYVCAACGFGRGFDKFWQFQKGGRLKYFYTNYVPGLVEISLFITQNFQNYPTQIQLRERYRKKIVSEKPYRRFHRNIRQAEDWINTTRNSSDPFFLFLHSYEVHDYWKYYPEHYNRLKQNHPDLYNALPPRGSRDHEEQNWISPGESIDPERIQALRTLYNYGAETVGNELGKFFSYLKRKGLYRKSIIVLLSDHGEAFSKSQKLFGHGDINDLLIRVPLYVKLPDNQGSDTSFHSQVQITDVFPMLFHYLGLNVNNPPYRSPAKDLLTKLVRGGQPSGRTVTRGEKTSNHNLFVRTENYKMIFPPGDGEAQYFKVSKKFGSEVKIPAEDVPNDVKGILVQSQKQYRNRLRKYATPDTGGAETMDPARKQDLKGLGYL